MEPGYRYRWTHLREYMGLTPTYHYADQPQHDSPTPQDDHVADAFVRWLTLTGFGATLVVALTALLP